MKRFVLVLLSAISACNRPEATPAANQPPGSVVDSIFPTEEEIRRFKAQVGGPFPVQLENASTSRTELIQNFISALERSDTASLRALVVTPREFIELYYPHSQHSRPPYKQSPGLLWFLMSQHGEKGMTRALSRFGGQAVGFQRLECKPDPTVEERNRLWDCVVRWKAQAGKPDPIKLFGAIMEREGRFKFLSYTNEL
jgi:hypothetical protein